jgi:phosphoglycolate phosphatase-like HAD superfamily hydrolase
MKTLYLDMDGVLCDFDSRWLGLFGRTPRQSRDNKEFSADWDDFIFTRQFESLDWHETGQELLSFVRSIPDINIEMLTSSGGKKHHNSVAEQKRVWLQNHGITYLANVVPGRGIKSKYANQNTILIDDTPDVIDAFNNAGGVGILHHDIEETKFKLNLALGLIFE